MPSSAGVQTDRKSTRLNSSHGSISYAVFCLKKKKSNRTSSPSGAVPRPLRGLARTLCEPRRAPSAQGPWGRIGDIARSIHGFVFFFNDTAPPEIYPLSLHDALPVYPLALCVAITKAGLPEWLADALRASG